MSAASAVGLPALITRAADRFALTDQATPVSSALGLWLLALGDRRPVQRRRAGFVDLGFTTPPRASSYTANPRPGPPSPARSTSCY